MRVNEAIRAKEVRLVDQAGKQMGIFSLKEALNIARQRHLDLIEVAPNAEPPVCRLLDYGKYLYERTKKEREAKRSQKIVEMKEIRLRPKTGDHDMQFKIRRIRDFLKDGAKVKVRMMFRGRELSHPTVGKAILDKIAIILEDVAAVEQQPRLEGRTMLMILSPLSSKQAGGDHVA